MIRITKLEEPDILRANAMIWTKLLNDKMEKGEEITKSEKSRYNHREIKEVLINETHGKCAYCESKIRHVTYGDIEHIVPKSNNIQKWFQWSNLTLACDICNTLKSNYAGDHETFIDPYNTNPEEYFLQIGSIMYPKPGCDAAKKTEALLKLNRVDLIERRKERLNNLLRYLDVIAQTKDEDVKKTLLSDFMDEAGCDKEFAALAREVVHGVASRFNL